MENINYEELLTKAPFVFKKNDTEAVEAASVLLTRSVGIEIECYKKDEGFNLEDFTSISNILDVNIDASEQRFRIPTGLKGFQCLYEITKALKKNSALNLGSGIHYHIDMTDVFDKIETYEEEVKKAEWILKELDSWNYTGMYNKREISNTLTWVRIQRDFKTLEFRIGEMTFDYTLMCTRILHLIDICDKLAILLNNHFILYNIATPEELIKNKIKIIKIENES